MRRFVMVLFLLGAGAALSGCETSGFNEGPVEYGLRPDDRYVYRRPPPPRIYEDYDRDEDIYTRPPMPRPYRPYDEGYRVDEDRY